MPQKPLLVSLAIALVGLLIALLLLPGIAGLIEGDFGYFRERMDAGWNNKKDATVTAAISDIYAWSFWRVGLVANSPISYDIYEFVCEIEKMEEGGIRSIHDE